MKIMEQLTWEQADEWVENSNIKKNIHEEPKWSFDCGFKLDFDGSLISVSSRFYPPNYNLSKKWEGKLTIKCLDKVLIEKSFVNDKLDILRKDVEDFIKHYSNVIISKLKVD